MCCHSPASHNILHNTRGACGNHSLESWWQYTQPHRYCRRRCAVSRDWVHIYRLYLYSHHSPRRRALSHEHTHMQHLKDSWACIKLVCQLAGCAPIVGHHRRAQRLALCEPSTTMYCTAAGAADGLRLLLHVGHMLRAAATARGLAVPLLLVSSAMPGTVVIVVPRPVLIALALMPTIALRHAFAHELPIVVVYSADRVLATARTHREQRSQ